jgi:negative regulator of flagellin synthesis FlgM
MERKVSNPSAGLRKNVHRIGSSQHIGRVQPGSEADSGSDQLSSSVQGREKSHIDELTQAVPDVRESKVAQIRAKIKSGSYKVKAEKIAEKIIKDNLLDEIY